MMLTGILGESLEATYLREREANWAAESEERIDAVERGELLVVDGASGLQDVLFELRSLLPRRPKRE